MQEGTLLMRAIMRVINKLRRFAPTLRSMFLKGEQIAKFEVILIFAIRKILA